MSRSAEVSKVCAVFGAALVALGSAMGCGATTAPGQDAEDTGPLATCGDRCDPAQVAASCAIICQRIERTGCSSGGDASGCVTSCSNQVSMAPSCAPLAYALLRCIETRVPTCVNGGIAQYVGGCDSPQQALDTCLNAGTPATATNPVGTGGDVPTDVCSGIPQRTLGGGSCSAGSASGPNAPATCTTSCDDAAGNVWESSCTGSTCACRYNGSEACTCTTTAAPDTCESCCPGTN